MTTNDVSDTRISDERLDELRRLEIGERDRYLEGSFLWLKHEDKANAFAELLAVRTLASRHPQPVNEPAEDKRELLMAIENAARMAEQGVLSADGGQAAVEIRSLIPARFRAASIPAPERSKGETVETLFQAISPFIDGTAWREVRAALSVALETPPLHKEGEAVFISRAFDPMTAKGFKPAAAPAPAPVPVTITPTHRHKKRGTEYVLIGTGKMQAEDWRYAGQPVDMREVAIYRSAADPTEIWVRPREEFEDGRFEALASLGEKQDAE